jgi:hypothetical protein
MRLRMSVVFLASFVAVILGTASMAAAAPAGTTHEGGNEHGAQESFADVVPCHDELGFYWITTTYNEQEHSTENKNGFWATFTQVGTFTAFPIDVVRDANGDPVRDGDGNVTPVVDANGNPVQLAGETFAGKFQTWFGISANPNVTVESSTFNIHGEGSAGTVLRMHDNFHVTTDGPGDPEDPATPVKVSFDKVNCF